MRVLGIDPGLNITGYGLVETDADSLCLIEAGEIRSSSKTPLESRLNELYSGLHDVVEEFTPDVLAFEELYAHYQHPRTAIIMGHARGVLFLVAGQAGIPVCSYGATRVKKSITGIGNATKQQVARMVVDSLSCGDLTGKPDVTDALAVALCHINAASHGNIL